MKTLYERDFEVYGVERVNRRGKGGAVEMDYVSDPELLGVAKSPQEASKMIMDYRKKNPQGHAWYEKAGKVQEIITDMITGTDTKNKFEIVITFLRNGYIEGKLYKDFKGQFLDKIKADTAQGIDAWLLRNGVDLDHVEWMTATETVEGMSFSDLLRFEDTEKENNLIELKKELRIPNTDVILEEGDKIVLLKEIQLPARDMTSRAIMEALINRVGAEEVLRQIVGDFLSGKFHDSMRIEIESLYNRYVG